MTAPLSRQHAAVMRKGLFKELAIRVRTHGIFAISEICKGLAVVTIGDMVIADELGELISVTALTVGTLTHAGR